MRLVREVGNALFSLKSRLFQIAVNHLELHKHVAGRAVPHISALNKDHIVSFIHDFTWGY